MQKYRSTGTSPEVTFFTEHLQTMKDEIIKEVWKAKGDIAARYEHNTRVMVDHLRKKEHSTSARIVDLRSKAEKHGTKNIISIVYIGPTPMGDRQLGIMNYEWKGKRRKRQRK